MSNYLLDISSLICPISLSHSLSKARSVKQTEKTNSAAHHSSSFLQKACVLYLSRPTASPDSAFDKLADLPVACRHPHSKL